jgi:uncharacterized protein YjiS (DUF1127 family)
MAALSTAQIPSDHKLSTRAPVMLSYFALRFGCGQGRSMMMNVGSGTARHRQTGLLLEPSSIWTTDVNNPSLAPVAGLLYAGVFVSAGRALRRVTNKLAECRRQRRARQELAAMSDHELDDIGVVRSDIDAILSGRYARVALFLTK